MQFKFDSGVEAVGWPITIPFDGYNVNTEGTEVTEMNFTIPELRQMLADAEMTAAEEASSNCDCRLCTYAPLASEEELDDLFQEPPTDVAPTVERASIEHLLTKAERAAIGSSELIEVAYAWKDLLG